MQKTDMQILEETESLASDNAALENKAKVLLVENDETTIDIIRIYFRGRYDLDVVMNALDAIKIAQEKQFDAILMDINLGIGLTGMDAVKQIKSMPSYKNVPIAALTAFAMMGDKEEFMTGGCTHYLSKPFDKNTLTNLVQTMLKG